MKMYVSGTTLARRHGREIATARFYPHRGSRYPRATVMSQIFASLHQKGSHGVRAVSAKWKTAERAFIRAHCTPLHNLVSRGVVTEKY